MPCLVTCGLAVAFLISMIYMYNATNRSQVLVQYEKQLPSNLQQLYKKIRDERQSISYYGYGLGFILSLIAIIYNSVSLKKGSTISMVCLAVVITFLTRNLLYRNFIFQFCVICHIKLLIFIIAMDFMAYK